MSTNYYVKGTGANPVELKELEAIADSLFSKNLPTPPELMKRMQDAKFSELFKLYINGSDYKLPDGIIWHDNAFVVDLTKFPGVKFIQFGYC